MKNRLLIPIALLTILFLYSCFGRNGLIRYFQLRWKLAELQRTLSQTRADNEIVRTEITLMKKSDHRVIEKNAREELGMGKQNETIYLFSSYTAAKHHAIKK